MATDDRAALRRLQRARRANRGQLRDWLEVSYEVELRVLVLAVVVFGLPTLLAGNDLARSDIVRFRDHAPGVASVVVAVAVWAAMRSGTRGAPLAPEAPDVRYLLLAPIPRALVLRGAAVRQLRTFCVVGGVAGAASGVAASERLPGRNVTWVGAGI